MNDLEAREQVARVDTLLSDVEGFADEQARDTANELVAALLDLYGEAFARLLDRVGDPSAIADDELISHLLLLHGMHPVPIETRVHDALSEVRPYLDSHGGDVELIAIEDGAVRLRMQGSCSGCPSSAVTLKLAIEDAIQTHAPDVERIEAEDAEPAAADGATLIQLEPLATPNGSDGAWITAGGLPQLRADGTLLKEVGGSDMLFCRVSGQFYAYRPGCPQCGSSLADATLRGGELTCIDCRHTYDVLRAGRCLDAPDLYLEPIPLLADEAGVVRVALSEPA
jgi:Fe-S cluster biogenesis protein NfuA/nitrite reductase/ring-hydroxylating ferredoxin subunit